MLKSNQVNVAVVIKEGAKLYKATFMEFKKYALLLVVVSSFISIYMVSIEFFIYFSYIAYIIAYILLLVLLIPFAYYAIVTNISVVGKLKFIIEGNHTKTFKEHYERAKPLFWNMVVFILLEAFLLIFLAIILLIIYFIVESRFLSGDFSFDKYILFESIIVIVMILAGIFIVYLSTRIGFTEIVICWNIKFKTTAIVESFKLTKYNYFKKIQIMFIAQLPSFIFGLIVFWINLRGSGGLLSIFELGISIALNVILLPWSYCIYYSLLSRMKVFRDEEVISDDGVKWQLY